MRAVAKLGALLALLLVSFGVGLYVENEYRPSLEYGGGPRPFDTAAQAWADHLAANESRGFGAAESSDGSPEPGPWSLSIELERGECLALSVYPYGCLAVTSLALQTEDGAAQSVGSRGQIQTVEHCAHTAAETVGASARLRAVNTCEVREFGLRVAVQRGPAARFPLVADLRGGFEGAAPRASQRAAVLGGLLRGPSGGRLLETVESVLDDGLQLVPRNAATCQEAARQGSEGSLQDRVPRTAGGTGDCLPEGVSIPVGQPLRGAGERILAVIDPGALGAACISVTLARMLSDEVAATPLVFSREGTALAEVAQADLGYRFEHRACGPDVITYAVRSSDHETYRLEIREADAEEGAAPTPAVPRGRYPLPRPLPDALSADERACRRGRPDGEACLRLGTALYTGVPGGRVEPEASLRAFRRGCEAGSADACAFRASARARFPLVDGASPEPRGADFASACESGAARACAEEGDRRRLTDGAPEEAMNEAYRLYGLACAGGVEEACANQRLLRSQGLVSLPEDPAAAGAEEPPQALAGEAPEDSTPTDAAELPEGAAPE